ncbi:MAG: DMT family transporter [Candidatus Beckwithbacteria bacterium]|nr:DMT family transporter [Patescibacteria group bacterium]
MPKRLKAYLALIVVAIVWGAALPIVKPALEFITPAQFLFFRYLLAAPLALPIFIYYFIKLKPKRNLIIKIILLEAFTYFTLIILYQGLKLTSAIEASLIGATGPIFTVLGGILFLKEKEEKREWLGLIISFFGTIILIVEPLLTGANSSIGLSLNGNLMIIGYNLTWTAYLLIAKKLYQKLPKLFISSFSYQIGLLCFFLINHFNHNSMSLSLLSHPSVAIAAIYMAVFGSIIGFTLYIYGQNLIEASEACLFTYLQGVVAIPVAIILLNESITWPALLAILIISIGIFLAEYRPRKITT